MLMIIKHSPKSRKSIYIQGCIYKANTAYIIFHIIMIRFHSDIINHESLVY